MGCLIDLGHDQPVTVVEFVDQPVGGLAVQRDRRQQPRELAMRGHARVLGAAPEGDDQVPVDVRERALALAVGVPGERTGPLAAPARGAGEPPDRRVGADRPGEGADRLIADVLHAAIRSAGGCAAGRPGGQQMLHGFPGVRLIGYVLHSVDMVASSPW